MDFIVALPESEGHTQILVVVDRFTKMAHFIPLKENATASDCAKAFLHNIWKIHGLPNDTISDRDAKWTGEFWEGLCGLLQVQRKLSTAFHPQTDGQTERVNQSLEMFLRTFVNYDQDDWYQLLPLAEYAYNNSVTSATNMSPFFANYGFNPRTNWPTEAETKNPASQIYAHWMKATHEAAREALVNTRERMAKHYDQKRIEQPKFQEGDLVMLNAKFIRSRRPAKKLSPKLHGPFKILQAVGKRAFKLDLEARWRIHPVFHVSLLEHYRPNQIIGRQITRPAAEEIEGDLEYEVERIVRCERRGSTIRRGNRRIKVHRLFYLVKWLGYPDDECTWEPADALEGAKDRVEEFHRRNPEQPRR
jgi:hypothetical protein